MTANPIVHWELMGPDGRQIKTFYSSIFDWKFAGMEGVENYHMTEGDEMVVNGAVGQGSAEMPSYQAIYVGVADIDATLAEVESLGGVTVVPRTVMPDVVTFAIFEDPAGNKVGLVERAATG